MARLQIINKLVIPKKIRKLMKLKKQQAKKKNKL